MYSNQPVTLFSVTASLLMAVHTWAQPLATVPMQGGMVMPMIGYHSEHGHLHVMLDPTVPALTPLMTSNPGVSFDPLDPWFEALDPSRQGLAFSRRYGFVMDTMTDPLPDGTAIWIRKLSGSPELGAYRYRSSAPKAFEPIFGTAGSAAGLKWDGMMFHPCFTAPAGTNAVNAVFQVYLADATTGAEVAGSASDPFDLVWTTLPDGRPSISIGQRLVLSWALPTGNYVLESTDSLPSGNWSLVATTPVTIDGRPTVILDSSLGGRFFRLRSQP